jgi:hypothetical protein
VTNVDEHDANDPQLCSDNVYDIYIYLRHLERAQPVKEDFLMVSSSVDYGNVHLSIVKFVEPRVNLIVHLEELQLFNLIVYNIITKSVCSKKSGVE